MQRWGYTFLQTDSRVPLEDRINLIKQSTVMYLRNENERELQIDTYEGLLSTEGKHEIIGNYGGQRFDAELQTNEGKAHLKFIVSEQTGAGYFTGHSSKDLN